MSVYQSLIAIKIKSDKIVICYCHDTSFYVRALICTINTNTIISIYDDYIISEKFNAKNIILLNSEQILLTGQYNKMIVSGYLLSVPTLLYNYDTSVSVNSGVALESGSEGDIISVKVPNV